MIPDIDSRLSRNILKSISYGLPLAEVVPDIPMRNWKRASAN